MFQSTLPRGERLLSAFSLVSRLLFQSTLPRGERRPNRRSLSGFCCFNPRSHGRSDYTTLSIFTVGVVFQSTLPRGERREIVELPQSTAVSIHAPTGGATLAARLKVAYPRFQSTLPRGERHTLKIDTYIEICFNPRSHGGSDNVRPCSHKATTMFQSTLPRGERQYFLLRFFHCKSVSIHAPTGGATRLEVLKQGAKEFQSTLPRGERLLGKASDADGY